MKNSRGHRPLLSPSFRRIALVAGAAILAGVSGAAVAYPDDRAPGGLTIPGYSSPGQPVSGAGTPTIPGPMTSLQTNSQSPVRTASRTDPGSGGALWGPDAVWHGRFPPCPGNEPGPACLSAAMRAGGASPEAIAFAQALGFQGYLAALRPYGRIAFGTVLYPFFANDNQQPVLLNGTPPIVDVSRAAQQVNIRSNPELAALVAGNRTLGLSDLPPELVGEEPRPGGGVRFLFHVTVSRCHACQAAARPELAYDFDAGGRFLGAHIVDAGVVAVPSRPGTCRVLAPEGRIQVKGGRPAPFEIVMTNRGQWCWQDIWTSRGGVKFGAPMHLLHRPTHGEVAIIQGRYATRVEYRPNPGFVGSDIFSVVNDVLRTVRLFYVSITG